MAEDERRAAQRVDAVVVVQLGDERHGVTRDVSDRGLLVATPFRFQPGDRVEVTIHAATGAIRTNARVIRVDDAPPHEEWRFRVAVELDDALPKEVVEHGTKAATTLLRRDAGAPPSSRK